LLEACDETVITDEGFNIAGEGVYGAGTFPDSDRGEIECIEAGCAGKLDVAGISDSGDGSMMG
jgi:hypothetical protein